MGAAPAFPASMEDRITVPPRVRAASPFTERERRIVLLTGAPSVPFWTRRNIQSCQQKIVNTRFASPGQEPGVHFATARRLHSPHRGDHGTQTDDECAWL